MIITSTLIIIIILLIWSCLYFCFCNYETEFKYKITNRPKLIDDNYDQLIPKKIFQIYHTNMVNRTLNDQVQDMLNKNKEYDYYFYNFEQGEEFIKNNFEKDVLDVYNTLIPYSYKSDLLRYCLIYVYGGIYLDMNFELRKDLKDVIPPSMPFICSTDSYDGGLRKSLTTGLLMCIPKHPFIKKSIEITVNNIKNRYYGNSPVDISGPTVLGDAVNELIGKKDKYYTSGIFEYGEYKLKLFDGAILGDIRWEGETIFFKDFNPNNAYRQYNKSTDSNPCYRIAWTNRKVYKD